MRPARTTLILVALAMLGCSSLLGPQPRPGEEAVVVAAHDLAPGTTLTDVDLTVRFLGADHVPDTVLRSEDLLVGRTVRHEIPAGWMFREERLEGPEADAPDAWRLDDPITSSLLRGPAWADVVWMRAEGGPCLAATTWAAPDEGKVALRAAPEVLEAARSVPAEARRLVLRWTADAAPPLPACVEAG
jgi:hypothetical protein